MPRSVWNSTVDSIDAGPRHAGRSASGSASPPAVRIRSDRLMSPFPEGSAGASFLSAGVPEGKSGDAAAASRRPWDGASARSSAPLAVRAARRGGRGGLRRGRLRRALLRGRRLRVRRLRPARLRFRRRRRGRLPVRLAVRGGGGGRGVLLRGVVVGAVAVVGDVEAAPLEEQPAAGADQPLELQLPAPGTLLEARGVDRLEVLEGVAAGGT